MLRLVFADFGEGVVDDLLDLGDVRGGRLAVRQLLLLMLMLLMLILLMLCLVGLSNSLLVLVNAIIFNVSLIFLATVPPLQLLLHPQQPLPPLCL